MLYSTTYGSVNLGPSPAGPDQSAGADHTRYAGVPSWGSLWGFRTGIRPGIVIRLEYRGSDWRSEVDAFENGERTLSMGTNPLSTQPARVGQCHTRWSV